MKLVNLDNSKDVESKMRLIFNQFQFLHLCPSEQSRVGPWRSHDPILIAMSVSMIVSKNLLDREEGRWEETSKKNLGIA